MCRELEYDDSPPVEEVVCRVDEVPEGGFVPCIRFFSLM